MQEITEETANELIDQFSKANNQMAIAGQEFEKLAENISKMAMQLLIQNHAYIVRKFLRSSFLTKWYWKKKMDKSQKSIDEFTLINSQTNKTHNHDQTNISNS